MTKVANTISVGRPMGGHAVGLRREDVLAQLPRLHLGDTAEGRTGQDFDDQLDALLADLQQSPAPIAIDDGLSVDTLLDARAAIGRDQAALLLRTRQVVTTAAELLDASEKQHLDAAADAEKEHEKQRASILKVLRKHGFASDNPHISIEAAERKLAYQAETSTAVKDARVALGDAKARVEAGNRKKKLARELADQISEHLQLVASQPSGKIF